ncbi:MAG: hypothetical protein HRU00_03415 [Myxococcales bacterium]|nr:hypothetical protein [Myxococcales bacterium]
MQPRLLQLAWCLLCSALALATLPRGASAQWGFGFEEREDWSMTFSGGRSNFGLAGGLAWGAEEESSTIDLGAGIELERSESFTGALELKPGNALLRFGYLPLSFGGETVLDSSTVIDGMTFSSGDRVQSKLDLETYDVALGYRFRIGRNWMVAPVVQVSVIGGLMDTIDLDLLNSAVKESFLVPIPLSGLRIEASPFARLTFFVEAKAFLAGGWGILDDARVLDGTAGASLSLNPNLLLTARYRRSNFKFVARTADADLDLEGFLFSLDFRF